MRYSTCVPVFYLYQENKSQTGVLMKDCTWGWRRVNSQKSTVHVRAISSPTFRCCDRISSTRSRWRSYFTTLTLRSHPTQPLLKIHSIQRESPTWWPDSKTMEGNLSRMWSSWMPGWLQSWLSYLGLFNKRGRLVRREKKTKTLSQSISINLL